MSTYKDDFHVEIKLKGGQTFTVPAGADRSVLVLFNRLTTRRGSGPRPPRIIALLQERIDLPGSVIADLIGVTKATVDEWKNGKRPIPAARMVQLLGLVVFIASLMDRLIRFGWRGSPVMPQLRSDFEAFDRFIEREFATLPPAVASKINAEAARFYRTLVAAPETRELARHLGAPARATEGRE